MAVPREGIRVVVIDDREFIDALHDSFLSRSDCSVVTARDAADAIAAARATRPDLIVLNESAITIDGEVGTESCWTQLRQEPQLRDIPLLWIGAPPQASSPVHPLPPLDAVMPRPLAREPLLGTMRGVLPVAQRESERRRVCLDVEFRAGAGSAAADAGKIRDIGRRGLFMETARSLELGCSLELTFALPEPSPHCVRAGGKVVRGSAVTRPEAHGAGVVFHELGFRDQQAIARFARGPGGAA